MKSYFRTTCQEGTFVVAEREEVELPTVGEYDVLVEIKACGLGWISSSVLNEIFKKCPQLNYPAGWEVAGVVVDTGKFVSTLKIGDRIAGILPLDSSSSGCGNFCVSFEFDLVKIPEEVSFEVAAASIGDGLKAYTALDYIGHVKPGETVLVTDPLTSWCRLLCQLCHLWGSKVLAVSHSDRERAEIQSLPVDCVLDGDGRGGIHVGRVIEETGLGVDVIIDNGVRLFTNEDDMVLMGEESESTLPHKHELIACLGVGGRLVTSHSTLQLDAPDSAVLHMKCASVGFLFEHAWTLSSTHMGRYQHVLRDIVDKLSTGQLKPTISSTVSLSEVPTVLPKLKRQNRGKIVMRT